MLDSLEALEIGPVSLSHHFNLIMSLSEMKKDPGIPNLFPFKEQLLKQMEDRKQRAEEQRARQKAQRHKEHAKRRSLQGLQNDAQKRTREFEKKVCT